MCSSSSVARPERAVTSASSTVPSVALRTGPRRRPSRSSSSSACSSGTPVVASPLYERHFALSSGVAVEDDWVVVATYPVRVVDGMVEVGGA